MPLHQITGHYKKAVLMLALTVCLVILAPRHVLAAPGEDQIKAAMIFNIMRFVDWPESALPTTRDTIDICVVNRGSTASAVEKLQEKQVKGKNIIVRQVSRAGGFSGCQVLLLSDTERQNATAILEQTRSMPVMTVGDSRGFAASGGVFGFMVLEGKIRFEVNLAAAQRHRIRISSQLLKLAQTVRE